MLQAELQDCKGSLAAAKAEVARLRRAAAAAQQRDGTAAGDANALAAERSARQGAEAAAAGARAALAAKADLVKDLRARVRLPAVSLACQTIDQECCIWVSPAVTASPCVDLSKI